MKLTILGARALGCAIGDVLAKGSNAVWRVKSHHKAPAMLQSGGGHEDILSSIVVKERMLAGKTYACGTQLGFGHVLMTALDGNEVPSARVQSIAEELGCSAAEIDAMERDGVLYAEVQT